MVLRSAVTRSYTKIERIIFPLSSNHVVIVSADKDKWFSSWFLVSTTTKDIKKTGTFLIKLWLLVSMHTTFQGCVCNFPNFDASNCLLCYWVVIWEHIYKSPLLHSISVAICSISVSSTYTTSFPGKRVSQELHILLSVRLEVNTHAGIVFWPLQTLTANPSPCVYITCWGRNGKGP